MPVLLSGENEGKRWSVEVMSSALGGYIACIQLGATIRVTPENYETEDEAQQAGCDLLAETFDELEESIYAEEN